MEGQVERDLKGQEGRGKVMELPAYGERRPEPGWSCGKGWRQTSGEAPGSGVRGQAVCVILVSFPSMRF